MPTVVENCSVQRYPRGEEQSGSKDIWEVLGDHSVSFLALSPMIGGVSVYTRPWWSSKEDRG